MNALIHLESITLNSWRVEPETILLQTTNKSQEMITLSQHVHVEVNQPWWKALKKIFWTVDRISLTVLLTSMSNVTEKQVIKLISSIYQTLMCAKTRNLYHSPVQICCGWRGVPWTDWLTDWSMDWLSCWRLDWLADWFTDWLTHSLTHWHTQWPTRLLAHSLTH